MRDVMQKRPAQVVTRRSELEVEVWTDTRHMMPHRIGRAMKRGRIAEAGPIEVIRDYRGADTGYRACEVRLLPKRGRRRRPAPAWRKHVLAGVAAIAALIVAGYGLAVSLADVPKVVWLGVGAALATWAIACLRAKWKGDVTIIQNVTIKR